MHKLFLKAVFTATIFSLTLSSGFAQQGDATDELNRQLEKDGILGKKPKSQKPQRPRSASEIQCESYADPHDQAVCFKAQSLELAKRASEAKRAALKSEPDSMSDVRKEERETEKKARKAREYQDWLYKRVDIKGCDPRTVEVHYQANPKGYGVGRYVRVYNPNALSVAIANGRYGEIVSNLCPNGSIQLYIPIQPRDGNNVRIELTASAVTIDGVMMVANYTDSMSRYEAPSQMYDVRTWVINLQRQYQGR